MNRKINWPDGKDFAFAIFDDPDRNTVANVQDVYSFINDLGFKTTKSVWPIRGTQRPLVSEMTCEDPEYLKWIYQLKESGFEIGFHNATFHSSLREDTIRSIETFFKLFGHYPRSMTNHVGCKDTLYWGNYRLSGFHEIVYNILLRNKHKNISFGHIDGNKYFWGDICKKRIEYVRNFVFSDINTHAMCPMMPYHDPERPYVNQWFASSDGSNVNTFNRCNCEKNQDLLEEVGGACIMYSHFAFGFYQDGTIQPRFKTLMERLSKKNGWFVPVSTLLDYLLEVNGHHNITREERMKLERKWLFQKIRLGTT